MGRCRRRSCLPQIIHVALSVSLRTQAVPRVLKFAEYPIEPILIIRRLARVSAFPVPLQGDHSSQQQVDLPVP